MWNSATVMMIVEGTFATLYMTLVSTLMAYVIGLPAGVALVVTGREGLRPNKTVSRILDVLVNVMRSIPFLILLILVIPLTRAIVGKSYGPSATIVPLTLAAAPFIARLVESSLLEVDKGVIEAAQSMGAGIPTIVIKVMLLEARSSLLSGLAIALGTILGYSAMAGAVGGGGLGYLVFSGIRTVSNVMILAGAIPACILALLVDRVFAAIETIVTPVSLLDGKNKDEKRRRKKREMFVIATAVVLLIALLFTSLFQTKKTADIRIASMDFTENEIFAYMLSESIERELGLDVETTPDLGAGSVCMSSIQSNEIDGYVDYTGTLYVNILKNPASSDVEQVYQDSVKGMKEQYGLEVLNSLNVNNTYTLSTTKELAEQYSLKTISDLKSLPQPVIICSTLAFMNREDGLLGVEDRYGFQFDKKGVDGSARYTALMNGEGQVIDAYSTDGLLKKFDLAVLEDDAGVFPPYYAVPVFRGEIMEKYPEIREITEQLASVLSTDVMAGLNYLVDEEGQKPQDVAHEFLQENLPEYASK